MNNLLKFSKAIALTLFSMSNIAHAAQQDPKTIITIPIELEEKENIHNNDLKTEKNAFWDEKDKFSCELLGIDWPTTKGSRLWRICHNLSRLTENIEKKYCTRAIPIEYSACPQSTNKHASPGFFTTTFQLPQTLPDQFVQQLVANNGTVTHETPNATIIFELQNKPDSLQRLGLTKSPPKRTLPYFFAASIIIGFIAYVFWNSR